MRYDPLIDKKKKGRLPAAGPPAAGHRLSLARCRPGRVGLLLLFIGLLVGWPDRPAAQAQSSAYWQYSAAASLHQVLNIDLRGDGVDEILIVTQSGQVNLLNADGTRLWNFAANEQVYAVTVLNQGTAQPEVVLGLSNRLLLLDAEGRLVGEIPLTLLPGPLNLLTGSSTATAQAWQEVRQAQPLTITPFRVNDTQQDILILLQNGSLQRYDRSGRFLWHHQEPGISTGDPSLRLLVEDMDGSGQDEVLLGFFDSRLRFSRLVLFSESGQPVWSQSISGRLTAAAFIQFQTGEQQPDTPPPPYYIAVGNSQGQVLLYNKTQNRLWPRTVNRPVTALTPVPLAGGQALAVGTEAGSVILYDENGRRLWTNNLAPDANRHVLALSAPPLTPLPDQPVLAALLVSAHDEQNADMILLDQNGRILTESASVDTQGPLSRLVDVNRDRHGEMLLLRFPNVELTGLGIGASDNAREWEYSLGTRPTAQLVVDLDRDGKDELIVGGEDGRLHRLRNEPTSSGLHRWVTDYDLPVTHLALLPSTGGQSGSPPDIIVIRYQDRDGAGEGRIERRQADSRLLWEQPLQAHVTSLLISNINETSESEILVGTQEGQLIAYSSSGNRLWSLNLGEENGRSVNQLLMLPQPDPQGARSTAAQVAPPEPQPTGE
jgi:hypothetical protein